MSTLASLPAAARGLERLIDYAGLFPPARLPLQPALEGYRAAWTGDCSWMLGRFIVPLELLREMPPEFPLSVIVPADEDAFNTLDEAQRSGAHRILALEVPSAAPERCADLRSAFGWSDVPVYLEISPSADMESCIQTAAALGLRAKLRCGGVETSAYPSPQTVARFIKESARAHLRFKATAGLHHPVRHFNRQAGTTMHGFLNLLAAAAFAGEDARVVEAIVAEEDAAAFSLADELRWRDLHADAAAVAAMRRDRFIGYGSCSFDEPVEDLRALGMLAK
jgi:hypothetical protein